MGIVLHIRKGGKIHNLALEGDEFRERRVFDLIHNGEVILTFSGSDIVGFTRTSEPEYEKRRADAALLRLRMGLLEQHERLVKDLNYKRMIGRAS